MKSFIVLLKKHMPTKKVKFDKYKHKQSEWITESILISIKYRDKLYRKMRMSTSDVEYERLSTNLKTYNKILRKTMREAQYNYYAYNFNKYKNDIKRSWGTLKVLLNKSKKSNFPSAFTHNNQNISNPSEIANKFNEYFSSVGDEIIEPNNSRNERNKYLKRITTVAFNFSLINDSDLELIFKELKPKSSAGLDDLSTKLLKLIKDPLIPILCRGEWG